MFDSKNVQVAREVSDWRAAIRLAAEPLLADGSIEPSYVDAMIATVEELGFYIVLDDDLAMPHARPEAGVHQNAVAFLKLEEACDFGGRPVRLIFVLAAVDSESHIDKLQLLAELFQDQARMSELKETDEVSKLVKILN